MGSKIKRSLFKYLIISLTLAIILSVVVQGIAQNISTNIQLKYVDQSKLYEYQNGYSDLFGDVPEIPEIPSEIMKTQDRVIKEICDFASSWCILFFTFIGVFLSLSLFYKRRLKIPFTILNEAAEKIGKQDLNFKITYNYDDELGYLCTVFEKMREKLAPLTVMKGYVEYLLLYYPENKLSKEKILEVLEELQSQTERISCFADTMKSINRLDEIVINRECINKDELLMKAETILTVLAQKYEKQFEIHSEIGKQQLYLDLSVFLEIFENLIDNAMRFAVCSIKVEFSYSPSRLTVSVRDDGKGFRPDELKNVVKPYYHGENAGSEHYGMGLYICKMLCEKQGGFLQVYNPPGGGACVEFYIVA